MKFGFVTCVQLGLTCMETIYRVGGSLDLAVTLPDDKATAKSGRVYLDDFCTHHDIDLLKAPNVNLPEVIDAITARGIDWLFVIGWSQIAKPALLNAPRRGVLGIHPTLLPEGRGRAAIPWAILKDLPETGVTLFKLDEGVDTGPIIAQHPIPLRAETTATELYAAVAEAHSTVLAEAWPDLTAGDVRMRDQDPDAGTAWPGRRPEDGRITVDMTVGEALRLIRATTRPYPGAYWEHGSQLVRVWAATARASGKNRPALALADGEIQAIDFDIE